MTLWLAYATTAQELNAQEACEALGYTAIVPRKVEAVRRGKKRWAEAIVSPYLPNYVWVEGGPDAFYAIRDIKEFRGSAMGITPQSERGVRAFIERVERDFATRMAQIEAGERVAEYQPGDLLSEMTGPFAGKVARFRRMIESAYSLFPSIEAEMELMGRVVRVKMDPINVRRVAG